MELVRDSKTTNLDNFLMDVLNINLSWKMMSFKIMNSKNFHMEKYDESLFQLNTSPKLWSQIVNYTTVFPPTEPLKRQMTTL